MKQSIYGFRGADVRVFADVKAQIEAHAGVPLKLAMSFRSNPTLIALFNALFQTLLVARTDSEAQGYHVTFDHAMTVNRQDRVETPALRVLLLRKKPPEITTFPKGWRGINADVRRTWEGEEIARQIQDLRHTLIYDRDTKTPRPCAYGDVAILMRSLNHASYYEDALERAGIPYVVTFHSGGHSSSVRNMMRSLQRLLLKPLLERAAQLIGVSQFEADFFSESLDIDRSRFVVVPNGAHLPKLDHAVEPAPYPLIVSSGRLERYKGHHHVIAAFAKLLQRRADARLRIAGTGSYEPELEQLVTELGIQDKVEIKAIPATNRQGMAELLSRASLVVLFSEYEAHPLAVMEALSLKRPVLVADTSGLSELAQRGLVRALPLECGPQALADAMYEQLESPLIASDVKLPTWEDCADSLLDVYQCVLRTRQALSVTLAH
ncbi:glycosyltransferase [bacterium]|nr:glycosyltransferase [bacterium]